METRSPTHASRLGQQVREVKGLWKCRKVLNNEGRPGLASELDAFHHQMATASKALWESVQWKQLKDLIHKDINDPSYLSDKKPKISKLVQVLVDHFKSFARRNVSTRVLIFCHLRSTVSAIKSELAIIEGLRPREFIGQSNRSGTGTATDMKGLNQMEQAEILRDFNRGQYNVLIATSIAEEGLDIAEVDLIVFFEMVTSPTRFIQRCGRTGRKRNGRIVLLLSEKEVVDKLVQSSEGTEKVARALQNATQSLRFYIRNPLMIPSHLPIPQVTFLNFGETQVKESKQRDRTAVNEIENLHPNVLNRSSDLQLVGRHDASMGSCRQSGSVTSNVKIPSMSPMVQLLDDDDLYSWKFAPIDLTDRPCLLLPNRKQPSGESCHGIASSKPSQGNTSCKPCEGNVTLVSPRTWSAPTSCIGLIDLLTPSVGKTKKMNLPMKDESSQYHTHRDVVTSRPSKSVQHQVIMIGSDNVNANTDPPVCQLHPMPRNGLELGSDRSSQELKLLHALDPKTTENCVSVYDFMEETVDETVDEMLSNALPSKEDKPSLRVMTDSLTRKKATLFIKSASSFDPFFCSDDDSNSVVTEEVEPPTNSIRSSGTMRSSQTTADGTKDKASRPLTKGTNPFNMQSSATRFDCSDGHSRQPSFPDSMDQRKEPSVARPFHRKRNLIRSLAGALDGNPSRNQKHPSIRSTSEEVFFLDDDMLQTQIEEIHPSSSSLQDGSQSDNEKASEDGVDTDMCMICFGIESDEVDPIVYCDGSDCHTTVHCSCYGIKRLPLGDYFCEVCEDVRRSSTSNRSPSRACMLCFQSTGVRKRSHNGMDWVHPLCVLFTPELTVDPISLQANNLSDLMPDRKALRCQLCGVQGGGCVQCSMRQCLTSFHPFCAFSSRNQSRNKVHMIIREAFTCIDGPSNRCAVMSQISMDQPMLYELYCPNHIKCIENHTGVISSLIPSQPTSSLRPMGHPDRSLVRGEASRGESTAGRNKTPLNRKRLRKTNEKVDLHRPLKTFSSSIHRRSRPTVHFNEDERDEGDEAFKRGVVLRCFEHEAIESGSDCSSDDEGEEEGRPSSYPSMIKKKNRLEGRIIEDGTTPSPALSGDFINDNSFTQDEGESPLNYFAIDRSWIEKRSPPDFIDGQVNVRDVVRKSAVAREKELNHHEG